MFVDPIIIKHISQSSIYNDSNPYNETIYDNSPLNQIVNQISAGKEWYINGKSIRTEYGTNLGSSTSSVLTLTETDKDILGGAYLACNQIILKPGFSFKATPEKSLILYIDPSQCNQTQTISQTSVEDSKLNKLNSGFLTCINYSITATQLTRKGYYAQGELYVTLKEDEDGNISLEFKDKLNQIVLNRQINGTEKYDTYYVYDNNGNLRYVLPPLAVDKLTSDLNDSSEIMKQYSYLYKYDYRNRCIYKKLPGCDPIYYVYDKADRLIFSQDGEQRIKGEWTFNKYDVFGRPIISGFYKTTQTQDALIAKCKNIVVTEKPGGAYEYTWNSLPEIPYTGTLSLSYYDDYYNHFNSTLREKLKFIKKDGFPDRYINSSLGEGTPKGLLIGTRTKTIGTDGAILGEIASKIYYDNKGRIIQTMSTNHLGGIDEEHIAYNFTGQPVKKMQIHTTDANGNGKQTELYTYTYDHAGRLVETKHQLNGGAQVSLAYNTYDDQGRLKTNAKAGANNLTTTYAYNIRSWTKSIVSPLFKQTLYYNESYGGSSKRYNGNIGAIDWTITGDKTRGYAFVYDNLSRLTAANYLENTVANANYKTAYTYDKHGNIQTLQRYGKTTTGSTFGLIDNLTISYTGNQLLKVDETIPTITMSESADFKKYATAAAEYYYNANGAMTKDLNKGITDIQYNSLNLPRIVDIKSPVAEARNEYTYSAGGQKLKVVQRWNPNYSTAPLIGSAINTTLLTSTKTTDYVGRMIYENGSLKRILVEGGYIENNTYYFYLTDHLGNNRIVADANGAVVQRNHYYPFGMAYAETPIAEQGKQPYKYNGKELDAMHGLNLYDYSARQLDNAIPRFTSVDPLAEKYYNISHYAYCANNPMKYIDPTGMWIMLTDSINSVNYRYDNGQLYREQMNFQTRSMEYVAYTPTAGSFFEGVLNALNDLGRNTATGQALIDFFSNDQNNIGIATNAAADANGNHIVLGEQGYPTIYMKSDLQGSNIPTQAGMQQSPFWLDLGHELGHGHDRSVRGNDAATSSQDGLITSTGFILQRTEVYATFRENQMRGEAGLPLRTHYQSNGIRGVGPSLINSAGRSTFLGTPYLPANTLSPPRRR